jgi:6,7-dimethyl-8-ribityllumazine synthase
MIYRIVKPTKELPVKLPSGLVISGETWLKNPISKEVARALKFGDLQEVQQRSPITESIVVQEEMETQEELPTSTDTPDTYYVPSVEIEHGDEDEFETN